MGRNKVSTTVYLLPDQLARLAAYSKRTATPVAQIIRWGIDEILSDLEGANSPEVVARMQQTAANADTLVADIEAVIARFRAEQTEPSR
jgi:predicted DNA-binding protein